MTLDMLTCLGLGYIVGALHMTYERSRLRPDEIVGLGIQAVGAASAVHRGRAGEASGAHPTD